MVATRQGAELIGQTQDNIYEAQRLMGKEQNIAFEQLKAIIKTQDAFYEAQLIIIRQQQTTNDLVYRNRWAHCFAPHPSFWFVEEVAVF
ncbi:hypothetical protein FRB96_004154 [Tulasnella sp. 330]|nr:hypothetical protein FRB96_004154 [Tulasnella sp. 330]